jgi:hypothetical protein
MKHRKVSALARLIDRHPELLRGDAPASFEAYPEIMVHSRWSSTRRDVAIQSGVACAAQGRSFVDGGGVGRAAATSADQRGGGRKISIEDRDGSSCARSVRNARFDPRNR